MGLDNHFILFFRFQENNREFHVLANAKMVHLNMLISYEALCVLVCVLTCVNVRVTKM